MPNSPLEFCEDSFDGITRLFPLPGLVMYPHVVQALHVFEPRYREMLECAMNSDRLISMAVLADGWQEENEGSPPLEPVVCLGQIITRTRLADGCSNILLIGMRRAKITEEISGEHLFRTARVELMEDEYCPSKASQRPELQRELLAAFQQLMPKSALAADQLTQSMGNLLSLGILTDLIAYSIQLSVSDKLLLLGETRVDVRAEQLLAHLELATVGDSLDDEADQDEGPNFPPDFSTN